MLARRSAPPAAGLPVSGAITMGVAIAIGCSGDHHGSAAIWWTLVYLPMVAAGAMIAAIRPRSPLGWMLLLIGTAGEVGRFQVAAVGAADMGTQSFAWLLWLDDLTWWLAVPLVPLVLLLLPDGRLRRRRTRPLFLVGLTMWVVLGMSIAFEPRLGGLSDTPTSIDNPVAIPMLSGALDIGGKLAKLALAMVFIAAVAMLANRWRTDRGPARRRMVWLAAPIAIGCVALLGGMVSGTGDGAAAQLALIMFLVAVPLAICASVMGDTVPGIDDLAGSAAVYGVVAALLTGTYVLLVLSIGSLIRGSSRDLGVIVATAAVALLFAPVRDRVQAAADRRLFGDATDPAVAVAHVGRALIPHGETDVLTALVDAVAEALDARHVHLVLADGTSYARGIAAEPLVRRELVWGQDSVGDLTVSLPVTPPHRSAATAGAIALIDALCPFVAAAVGTISLVDELQASRAGLVDAIEDERRRIRNDLHDGLGPTLAGVGLGLETLANLAADETPDFRNRLSRLRDDVATVYDDLRFLSRGLRPPALDELGLVGALRSQAGRLTASDASLQIRIAVDGDPQSVVSLPAAVELAAYHVAIEALTNVVRHAAATSCTVKLTRRREFQLEIRDDGRGIASRPAGVGLLSMRDRCEQLGGRLELAQVNGSGTVVTAWLPIR